MGGPVQGQTQRNRPLQGLHDVELAQLSMAGDRAAFGELARRHGDYAIVGLAACAQAADMGCPPPGPPSRRHGPL